MQGACSTGGCIHADRSACIHAGRMHAVQEGVFMQTGEYACVTWVKGRMVLACLPQ